MSQAKESFARRTAVVLFLFSSQAQGQGGARLDAWTDPVFSSAVDACTQVVIDAQHKQFLAQAADRGMADPESEFAQFALASRRTFAPICSCTVRALSAQRTPGQFLADLEGSTGGETALLKPGTGCVPEVARLEQELRRQVESARQESPLQQALRRYREASRAFCADRAFAPYLAKSPCLPDDITARHLADAARIAEPEQPVVRQVMDATDARLGDFIAAQRAYGGAQGRAIAAAYEQARIALDDNLLRLARGAITWGEFNRVRKDVADALKAGHTPGGK